MQGEAEGGLWSRPARAAAPEAKVRTHRDDHRQHTGAQAPVISLRVRATDSLGFCNWSEKHPYICP